MTTDTVELDCRGLQCPLPVLKLEKRIETLPKGARLELRATDPVAKIDIPLFCLQNGHECTSTPDGEGLRFLIVRG